MDSSILRVNHLISGKLTHAAAWFRFSANVYQIRRRMTDISSVLEIELKNELINPFQDERLRGQGHPIIDATAVVFNKVCLTCPAKLQSMDAEGPLIFWARSPRRCQPKKKERKMEDARVIGVQWSTVYIVDVDAAQNVRGYTLGPPASAPRLSGPSLRCGL